MHKDLKTLQSEWYEKLKNEGFEDIEDTENRTKTMVRAFKDESKLAYYEKANAFLEDYEFDSPEDAIVWRYHCIGKATRQIASELEISKSHADRIIQRLKKIMLKAIL